MAWAKRRQTGKMKPSSSERQIFVPKEHLIPVSAWIRLLTSTNLLFRELRRVVESEYGCTFPQFDVLARLYRQPGGLTFAELSQALLVTSGSLTGIVDRLSREGLVRRQRDSLDRRVVRVLLTRKGEQFAKRVVVRHIRDVEKVLSVIPRPLLTRLRNLLGDLRDQLQSQYNS